MSESANKPVQPAHPKRPHRKTRRFQHKLSTGYTNEDWNALVAVADADEVPIGDVVRDCVTRGLPLVREARRRKRRAGRPAGG